jgi:DNA helicase-2/ATP-dependent DNA helicase PcrA
MSINQNLAGELTKGLNSAQVKAVLNTQGPLRIIAGPGSGKTKVLTHRIALIVKSGLAHPSNVLAVTFTNKAASEMRDRINLLIGEESQGMWVSTFHSACLRTLKIYASEANLPKSFTILDADSSKSLLSIIMKDLGFPCESEDLKKMVKTVSTIKNRGLSSAEIKSSGIFASSRVVYDAYMDKLSQIAALDFDDILLRTLKLLSENEEVRSKLQKRFKYILVDEYQDTNIVQYKILALLAPEKSNICIVGDRDQSIYAFRGSSPDLIEEFDLTWKTAKTIVLTENYRSTQAILDVCMSIIDLNPAKIRESLVTKNPEGSKVRLVTCYDDREEAKFIVEEIGKLKGDTAVLMRTNSQTRSLEEALVKVGTSYILVGALKFYDRQEIKDALSYLKLIVNPRDEIAFLRCVNLPRRSLGQVSINKILEYAKQYTDFDLIQAINELVVNGESTGKQREGLEKFAIAVDNVTAAMDFGPEFAIRAIIHDAGLLDHYKLEPSSSNDREKNLEQLYNGAESFKDGEGSNSPDGKVTYANPVELTQAWLEHVSLVSSLDVGGELKPKVTLMTVHASKGREFDNVYVIGLEENLFPYNKHGEKTNEEEERRLLFVACSRAKSHLTLSWASRRHLFGRTSDQNPSSFLDNLSIKVERIDKTGERSGSIYLEDLKKSYNDPNIPKPAFSTARLSEDKCIVGAKVKHPVFGLGEITEYDGENLTTLFGEQFRILKRSMAPLEIVQ